MQERIKPHDDGVLARVQALVHGCESQDMGGCVTHRVGSACARNVGECN
jgi:hypothetical protein